MDVDELMKCLDIFDYWTTPKQAPIPSPSTRDAIPSVVVTRSWKQLRRRQLTTRLTNCSRTDTGVEMLPSDTRKIWRASTDHNNSY